MKPKQKPRLKRKATGEAKVFKEIWDTRERVSFVTGLPLPTREAYAYYFSHILKKKSYKKMILYKKNIQYMTLEEHDTWEYKQKEIIDDPRWAHVFKLKQELIDEYKNFRSDHGDNAIPD